MCILNDYMVCYRCEKGMKLFKALHKTAPILKILALLSFVLGIFYPYVFIASVFLWVLSVGINYIKWYTVFNYNYVIKKDRLTVMKTYTYIKPYILADVKFKDILRLEIIQEEDLEHYDTTNKYFCEQDYFNLYLLINAANTSFIIVVNNYFYALLQRTLRKRQT